MEAERGVLGSILLDAATDNRVLDLCIESGITADSFFSLPNRLLFETLSEMARASQIIDPLTLTERLRALNRLEEIGGAVAIQTLIDETPTAAHAEYYINILRQKHLLRAVITCARDAERRCFDEAISADLILSEVEQKFLSIADRRDGAGLTWPQAITNTMGHIDRLFSLGPGAVAGLPTGLANLDRKLKGLRNGEMIVLAARPSMGKTSLAMNIAERVALGKDMNGRAMKGDHNRPHPVAVFSLEMSTESLAMRMLCGLAEVPSFKIDQGLVNPKKINRQLTDAASKLAKAPIYVDDTGGLDVMDMRARARRMKKRYKVELIVIDYLQLCNCREFARQGRQIETSQISGQIKAMAKELNLPVIVLSQLSRAPEQRGDKTNKPKLSDLRDSGAIEQDADVVLLLRRPCKASGDPEFDDKLLAIVDVAKHRNGPTGEVRLNFEDTLTRFSDRTDQITEDDRFEPDPDS
ncbi:MAG TPA: replicative DNA helicase [Kiritimatiellia bacterium]|jgi:replicative DNA helicase|nr:replicative DNA helicase [Kiritimatiellia bacterium]HOM58512.1 replicative DNA helicase [Kiritimatiellia bacterium]HOR97003.1 replicative DNA helicase [Kiritimatiellia bacterium]HPC49048.1 replicative DNA helicase [Kiritimatiellia bacterium]HPK37580.1 replicative DNA helicase [Kiritimatiellia bacterium]